MKTVQISLNSVSQVDEFVRAISPFEFDFDMRSGRYTVDAKSNLGILSLDMSRPIDLDIYGEGSLEEVMEALAPFLA